MSAQTAFGYARARWCFPEEPITHDLIKKASTLSRHALENIPHLQSVNRELNLEASVDEMLSLAHYDAADYRSLLTKGYPITALIEYPFLADNSFCSKDAPLFPHVAPRVQQERWCIEHAFYVPDGWNRKQLGRIVLSRMKVGVDANVHDATYWLKEFEVPNGAHGVVYKDHATEMQLVHALTNVPADLERRVPTKPTKYRELFAHEGTQFLYEAILPIFKNKPLSFADVHRAVQALLIEYKADPKKAQSLKIPLPSLKEEVRACLEELKKRFDDNVEISSQTLTGCVGTLRATGQKRTEYIDTAQAWIARHPMTPRDLLTFAWANRPLALADKCADNPRAIKQWADLNALRASYNEMEARWALPKNIERSDIITYRNWFSELVRCYDGTTAIETVARLKESWKPECDMAPAKIDLGNGWSGEVLRRDDPRGMTIGFDTGCCMTLTGASASCIDAGYTKPSYGFFALYRENQLVAQSFLYVNTSADERVIVCDNIEASQGRDRSEILSRYKSFFAKYLETQLRQNKDNSFSRVHVGTGYTAIGLEGLPAVDALPVADSIYTDARVQKLLLALPEERVAALRAINTEFATRQSWPSIKEQIMAIEADAFEGRGYSEGQLEEEFCNPKNIVVVLKDAEKVVGYTTAIVQDKETLYVSSTALLRSHQGKGLVADMMRALDMEAYKRGYRFYERDTRVDNGYAEKLKRNYAIVSEEKPSKTPHGVQQHLRLAIPNLAPAQSLSGEIIKHKEASVDVQVLSLGQAAIAADLEQSIYPSALQNGQEFFEEELTFDPGDEHTNASFLLTERTEGREQPIGYTIAYMTESEFGGDESVLYVADTALLPEQQKKGYGRKMFERIIQFAESRQGMPIEFHARESTSYAALIHAAGELEGMGYRITSDQKIEGYFDDTPNEGVHLVRLEKINPVAMKKVA